MSIFGAIGSGILGGLTGGLSSGISGAVGSVFGGGEKRPRYEPYMKAMVGPGNYDKGVNTLAKVNAFADKAAFNARMELAKQHGIHPLHMMGLPSTSQAAPSVVSSGRDYSSFAMAGSDIARSLMAGQSNMERLQERLLEAQIEGQEIDNVSRASQVARTNAMPGSPPSGLMLGERLQSIPHSGLGISRGVHPLHTVAIDEDGNPVRLFNSEDLGDNDIAQLLHTMRYTLPDVIEGQVVTPVRRKIRSFFSR